MSQITKDCIIFTIPRIRTVNSNFWVNIAELRIMDMAIDSLDPNPLFTGMWKYVVTHDDDMEISLYIRDRTLRYRTEIRQEIRKKHLPFLLEKAKFKEPCMLVAGKIFPDVKEILRQTKVPYIEANGNISIQLDDLFIWVDSNKPITIGQGSSSRAFTKTGLKVVFHFLLNEALLERPYRELADITGTSPGNITNVMNALKASGFVVKDELGALKLDKKKQLLEKWMAAYEQVLKPSLEIGSFRFINTMDLDNWKRVPLEARKSMWGGLAGAHLLTGQLRPAEYCIYTSEQRNDLISNYRLIRDPNGNVKIYQKFWNYNGFRSNVVPPLLIYAELMDTGEKACIEAAERVYDEHLKNTFGK